MLFVKVFWAQTLCRLTSVPLCLHNSTTQPGCKERSKDQCLALTLTHKHTLTHTHTHTRKRDTSHRLLFCNCAPGLCDYRAAMKTRTCFRGITVAQQTGPLATHTHTHSTVSSSDSTLISSERASNRRDAKKWGPVERLFALNKPLEEITEEADATKQDEKLRSFAAATCAQCQSFSGSIVLTSLQRGHSEERGRTQKGKGKD